MMTPLSGPHIVSSLSVTRVMALVLLALLPATAFSVYQFGFPALYLLLLTIATALLIEALMLRLSGASMRALLDGSALLTAVLLALSLPPWAPWWIGVVGGVFAMVVGKHVFGGLGQNLFNPAMLARVALLISFPVEMTRWVVPQPLLTAAAPDWLDGLRITFLGNGTLDSVSGATVLGHSKTELSRGVGLDVALPSFYSPQEHLLGTIAGSLGETSALLLLFGGLFLLWRRIISWHIPLAMLGSVALLATMFHVIDGQRYADPFVHLLSGGLMLGAFFIATDPVTSPSSVAGQLIFGAGCGLLTFIIRTYGGFPEGVAFAVLLMNAATPLLDHYLRPRAYGRSRKGTPLQYPAKALEQQRGD